MPQKLFVFVSTKLKIMYVHTRNMRGTAKTISQSAAHVSVAVPGLGGPLISVRIRELLSLWHAELKKKWSMTDKGPHKHALRLGASQNLQHIELYCLIADWPLWQNACDCIHHKCIILPRYSILLHSTEVRREREREIWHILNCIFLTSFKREPVLGTDLH